MKRIVASSVFTRSSRLTSFLKYVYALAEKGRFDDIHEQNIGAAVFGRTHDYDPAADSIVRSHASRLRHRLKEYFDEEGQNEPLVLTIPRGSYIPTFEPRSHWKATAENPPHSSPPLPAGENPTPSETEDPAQAAASQPILHTEEPRSTVMPKEIVRLRLALFAAIALILVLVAVLLFRTSATHAPQEPSARQHLLWKEFVGSATEKTLVVSSDSGLVMYQHLTGQPVTLASYVSGDYLKNTDSPLVQPDIVRKFGTRRYTPAVDLASLERITNLFGGRNDRLSFRYARDLRIEDLKRGNAILFGSAESNPWVQLYEPSLNFHFEDDLLHDKARMVNLHPKAGEADHYDSTPQESTPTIYGVVAYRANQQTPGHVLILEGQTMAGTQTAADFVFDDVYLLPFLKKISRSDGSIPDFEVLLRSHSFAGQSSRLEIVAYRAS